MHQSGSHASRQAGSFAGRQAGRQSVYHEKNTAQGINAQCAITPRSSLARELTVDWAVLSESVHEVRVTVDEIE